MRRRGSEKRRLNSGESASNEYFQKRGNIVSNGRRFRRSNNIVHEPGADRLGSALVSVIVPSVRAGSSASQ